MDRDELRQVKFYLGISLIFLLSMWQSWRELKYAVWGETTTGKVTQVREVSGSRTGTKQLQVDFRFSGVDGGTRSEYEHLPLDAVITEGDQVDVEYLPGEEDSARIEGQSNMSMVYLFLGSLLAMGFVAFRVWKMAHNAVHGTRSRRW
ncbi:DUF3592 domain-containing protein [bacterium]|nr:DUF3592 domain-containing protein [bacterium]